MEVSPQDETSILYALTISPPAGGSLQSKYDEQIDIIQRLLRRASHHFRMYPELDDNARLHWHGYITIHDYIKWTMQVVPGLLKNIGFIKVKKIKDLQGWIEYSTKGYDLFKQRFRQFLQNTQNENTYNYDELFIEYVEKLKRRSKLKPAIEVPKIKTLFDYGFTISDE